jgi:hypothetical protein
LPKKPRHGSAGTFVVAEGRRRCKAIAELADAREWPAPPHLDALVVGGPQTLRHEVRTG